MRRTTACLAAILFCTARSVYALYEVSDTGGLGETIKAGVRIHAPPPGQSDNPNTPEAPIDSPNVRTRWMYTTFVELVVDGEIVDLNRIPLPADTPIIDERFKDGQNKSSKPSGE